jgi:hypothetical protein
VTYTFGTSTSIRCYLNNNLLNGSWRYGNGDSPVQTNTQPVTIGGLTSGERTTGLIDEVMIFNRALANLEVQELYEGGKYAGDFVYPHGVNFIDYAFFAEHWLETDYGDVNGIELSGDGQVNWHDFGLFAEWWMLIGCGDCGGTDFTGEGDVDYLDLDVFAGYWLESEYGDCGGAELTGDGQVGPDDLREFSENWLKGI